MDLLARKEALSHQIEMTEEGLTFIGLHELYFRFVGRTGNISLGELDPLGQSS